MMATGPDTPLLSSTGPRKETTELSESRASSDSNSSLESGCTLRSPREESSLANSDVVRNAIIGFSDGLTVPFALTAGLTSFGSQHLVVIGGLAELVAGALSMGLGAYLAASTDRTAYLAREEREMRDAALASEHMEEETYAVFESYGLGRERVGPLVEGLKDDQEMWVKVRIYGRVKPSCSSLAT